MTRSTFNIGAVLVAIASLSGIASAEPAKWTINLGGSTIGFSGSHAGKPFSGKFKTWSGDISFDPRDLRSSKVTIQIDTSSAVTGDALQETTLEGEEWFNSGRVKSAKFWSRSIRLAGQNQYVIDGTLQIKGRNVPVSLPFHVAINGKAASASGKLTLDRAAFDLGMKSDPSATWVSRNIVVTIAVKASR